MIVLDNLPFIGSGCRGMVFQLSETKVIKIFKRNNTGSMVSQKIRAVDETFGGRRPGYLPVLKLKKVLYEGNVYIGAIKKYIPHAVSMEEAEEWGETYGDGFDVSPFNMRKDEDDTVYMVDTQTQGYIEERNRFRKMKEKYRTDVLRSAK
jgi:hypothetical protein